MHRRLCSRTQPRPEAGYILPMVMLVLMVVGMMAATLMAAISVNQQHVIRDRALTQSLAIAEAGLNQFLWMVASGESRDSNGFVIPGNTETDPHKQTVQLTDAGGDVKGTYTMLVTPPESTLPNGETSGANVTVTVTGVAEQPADVPRTITASLGRPSFSEYVLLVDQSVYIGGPLTRKWWGKTHSNTQIRIETANINDFITCSNSRYQNKDGVYSEDVAANDPSTALWEFPVPVIPFSTVTADFVNLRTLATLDGSTYAYRGPSSPHGWYIKLTSDGYYAARVTAELEQANYNVYPNQGGYLTHESLGTLHPYPDNGIIFVYDNVWVEGTGLDDRVTIAATGQFNNNSITASVNVVGDITYAAYDGSVAVGLIAEQDVKIPMYAPLGKYGTLGTSWGYGTDDSHLGNISMEIDAALIAQTGKEYVNFNGVSGPRRNMLTIYGSVSSCLTPYRCSVAADKVNYAGFGRGSNDYDEFLLKEPPPHFPTVGSYQILAWRELPSTQQVDP
jgi:Tfp pilus assembly protein PilX